MFPRGSLDIGWRDMAVAALRCLWSDRPERMQRRIEARWSADGDTLACLSVRSGLDLLLRALALPPGSEVLVSAITIPDMLHILAHHGLVAIPIDLDPAALSVDPVQLAQSIRPQTKAILIAHLFGSRMPLAPVLRIAQEHGLFVIEDCAQAHDTTYRGHPDSDASLFSFGPIKTATALGGAVIRCKDRAQTEQLRRLQAIYPRQPNRWFLRRLLRFAALKLLAHPVRFGVFVALCRLRGRDHDQVIAQAVRGFAGADMLARIRYQPSRALLHLLERRLVRYNVAAIRARVAFARRVIARLPNTPRPGGTAAAHTHWVLPIESADPDALIRLLWAHGFDATRRASTLTVVPPPPRAPDPANARRLLERLVFLPMYRGIPAHKLTQLGQIFADVERAQYRRAAPVADRRMVHFADALTAAPSTRRYRDAAQRDARDQESI